MFVHTTQHIKEVIPYTQPVPVPGAPYYAEGILMVRGIVVPIVSGCSMLDPKSDSETAGNRIIILELGREQLGVSVDDMGGMVTFENEDVDWTETNGENGLVQGVIQINGTLHLLTDFTRIAGAPTEDPEDFPQNR